MEHINKFLDSYPESTSSRTPSCKPISQPIGGLFIGHDNMKLAEWREDCMEVGEPYAIETQKEDPVTKKFIEVTGRLIVSPKLVVLRHSPFLKMDAPTRSVIGEWNATADKTLKEQKLAFCVKRYLIFFLDDEYRKLHRRPIQLTARGYFLHRFDTKLLEFNLYMFNQNGMQRQKLYLLQDSKDTWIAANFVFEPQFVSEKVGDAGKRSNACLTKEFAKTDRLYTPHPSEDPTEHDRLFRESKDWYKLPYQKSTSPKPSVTTDDIVYEEFDL